MRSLLLALLVAFPLCTAVAAERPTTIRIGVAAVGTGGRPATGGSVGATAAHFRALEKAFEKDGIAVKYTYYSGAGPTVNEALANRQLDLAFQGDLPALVARAGGMRTRIVMATNRFAPIYVGVPASSTARSLEDLKGKRIAVFKGTNLHLAFWAVLAAKGLKESDFKIVNLSTFDGNAALLSEDIDAQVSGNDLFPLMERSGVRVVYSTLGDPKLGRLSHLLVTEEFHARHPEIVQRVVNALLEVAAWEADEANRAKVYEIWTRSGLGLCAWTNDYDPFALRDRDSPLLDEFYRSQYKRLLRFAREQKLVRGDFDVDTWLDPTYLGRGIEALGLSGTWRELDTDGKPKGVATTPRARPAPPGPSTRG